MRRLLLALAAIATIVMPVAVAGEAEAAVTNCGRTYWWNAVLGGCQGTTSNSPYTTQWALMLQCSNGQTITSGWIKAGAWPYNAYLECPSGSRVSTWFLFR